MWVTNMVKIKIENGYYFLKLEDILKKKNMSINKLMRDINNDYKVIKRIMSGNLVRIDKFVIERLCSYLECTIIDIIEYIPKKI